MASSPPPPPPLPLPLPLPFLLPCLLLLSAAAATSSSSHLPYNDKLTHLHFFFHETYGGPNASTITVVNPSNTTSYAPLGSIGVGENYSGRAPSRGSNLLGRTHELAVAASLETPTAYLSLFNFFFTACEYNGSSISIFGRAVLTEVLDRTIIGGCGKFRMVRGYTISKLVNRTMAGTSSTSSSNLTSTYITWTTDTRDVK